MKQPAIITRRRVLASLAAVAVVVGAVLLLGPDAQGPRAGLFANGAVSRDLDDIRTDTLRVLVTDHHLVYQRVGAVETGLEYEIMERYARKLGLPIRAVLVDRPDSVLPWLQRGVGDVVAVQLNARSMLARQMAVTAPYRFVSPVLLTLRSDPLCGVAGAMEPDPDSAWVSAWSPFAPAERLLPGDVTDNTGGVLFTDTGRFGDGPVANLALGRIKAAFVANASAYYFLGHMPQLALSAPMGESVPLVFGTRKNARRLLRSLDDHLTDPDEREAIGMLMTAYGPPTTAAPPEALPGCVLPPDVPFDRTALAAILFRSIPMDSTHRVDPEASPQAQLQAAADYLAGLDSAWRSAVPDPRERLGFVVASFEVGAGHVLDAQALAAALGLDPQRWTCSVERALTLLAFPRYFTHPAARHGVCSDGQVLMRVREVLCTYASTPAALSTMPH